MFLYLSKILDMEKMKELDKILNSVYNREIQPIDGRNKIMDLFSSPLPNTVDGKPCTKCGVNCFCYFDV